MVKPLVHCARHPVITALKQPTLLSIQNNVMQNITKNDNDNQSTDVITLLLLILNMSLVKVKIYIC